MLSNDDKKVHKEVVFNLRKGNSQFDFFKHYWRHFVKFVNIFSENVKNVNKRDLKKAKLRKKEPKQVYEYQKEIISNLNVSDKKQTLIMKTKFLM